MVKKLARWFNEQFLGVVYYEMEIGDNPYFFYGEVITENDTYFEMSHEVEFMETKMKKVINTFEGTPINKIKFVKKYV
jgi:hypothetical protein